MKTLIVNRNIIVSIFAVMLLIYGLQGISYAQDAPDETLVEFVDVNLVIAVREELGLGRGAVRGVDLFKIPKTELLKLIQLDVGSKFKDDQDKITDLTGLEHATQLRTLRLRNNQIRDVALLAQLTNLTTLYLGVNQISDVSALAQLTNLATLDLESNQISDVSALAQLTNLTKLYLSWNQIRDVAPLTQLTHLTVLGIRNNSIVDVAPLTQLTNLTVLNLIGNSIRDIASLAQLTHLRELYLSSNQIVDVASLAQLTNLTTLNLEGNQIVDVASLAQLTNLTTLNLEGNQISDVALTQLTSLTYLNLSRNNISDIPLTQLTSLTDLNLSRNNISDLTPFAEMIQLRDLKLSFNIITDVTPLAQLRNLRLLDLSFNSIEDITPLAELTEQTYIIATANPVKFSGRPSEIAKLPVPESATTPTTTTTDVTVSISTTSVESPKVGEQITFNLNITSGRNVAGYQATVQFDTTTLRYVESSNGDYLPTGAFFVEPVVQGNLVKLNAASLAGETDGDGTLATLTFEVIAVKASTLTLSDVLLTNSAGETFVPQVENAETTESTGRKGDVNGDGIVNIADLVLVASNLGKTGQNAADVNGDSVVNIADLVLVAGALGTGAAAPSLNAQALPALTAADVKLWLSQAQHLTLTDTTSQRGILFLEQLLAALTPTETALLANFPNPFNPETWIPYHLAKDTDVTLTIYAINGTLVRTLALGHQPAGMYHNRSRAAYWDGKNAFGEPVASGVYFYTLTAGDFTATRKMLIRK